MKAERKIYKLRCKDTVKKIPHAIPPKKGKKAPYKRDRGLDIDDIRER